MSGNRGRLVLAAVGAIFALAVLGLYQLDSQAFNVRPTDHLYRVVQLFFAEGDWTANYSDLPLSLELARFLAPVVTVASLVILFAEGIWIALINFRLRFYKNHVVVVGLSTAAMVLIRNCRKSNIPVVAIEIDPGNPHVRECRGLFVPVLLGDAKYPENLTLARTINARCLISFIPLDDDNVELSLRAAELLADEDTGRAEPLRVVLQLMDMQLGNRLENYPKFFKYPQQLEVRFFNQDEQAARGLFRAYFPELYADALGSDCVHIVVVGYSNVGRHVLKTTLKQAHYGNRVPLRVTVLDPLADRWREIFLRECPAMPMAARVEFAAMELNPEVLARNLSGLPVNDATLFTVCAGTDVQNMGIALELRQLALLAEIPNAPIFVSLRESRGLARLVEGGQGNPEIPDGLYPFGMHEQLMRVDFIVGERLDEIAVALHEQYLDGLPKPLDFQSSHRPWGMLPEVFRNDTRAQADHFAVKLRAAGHVMVKHHTDFEFSESEVLRLAEIEKTRWNAERASRGWVYAEHRSDLAKTHPGMKTWAECGVREREFDMASVRGLPAILRERLGLGIARQIVIGITGHRAHRLKDHLGFVEQAVREELQQIARRHPGCEFAVLSALADGSDRLVADLAVEVLRAELYAALPLPYEIYNRSFGHSTHLSNQESNDEFQRFIGRAKIYFEMPLRFGGARLLEQNNKSGELARSRQYALAGAYIVSRSHEFIAIWDGHDARGVGGTATIVEWRSAGKVDPDYEFGSHFFTPVEMTPPRIISLPNTDT